MVNSRREYGITFNGIRSNEFGLDVIEDKTIGFPSKVKIVQKLPYSNNVIDLSAIYGEETYDERNLEFTLLTYPKSNATKDEIYQMWTKAVDWLMNTNGKVPLIDDVMSDYFYLAEVQKAPDFKEFMYYGKLTVEFVCYPYRIKILEEGDDDWDSFDFEDGIAQEVDFNVNGELNIELENSSEHGSEPEVETDSEMTIFIAGKTVVLSNGIHTYPDIYFSKGIIKMKIVGKGYICFHWHKEVI